MKTQRFQNGKNRSRKERILSLASWQAKAQSTTEMEFNTKKSEEITPFNHIQHGSQCGWQKGTRQGPRGKVTGHSDEGAQGGVNSRGFMKTWAQ